MYIELFHYWSKKMKAHMHTKTLTPNVSSTHVFKSDYTLSKLKFETHATIECVHASTNKIQIFI